MKRHSVELILLLPTAANIFKYLSLPCCLKHNHNVSRVCASTDCHGRGSKATVPRYTSIHNALQKQTRRLHHDFLRAKSINV